MKHLKQTIENYGIEVTYTNKSNIWLNAKDTIIMCSLYELFGLADDDLMLHIKQKFYQVNIKIDLSNPNNITTKSKKVTPVYVPVGERKENIRKLLKDKFKLIP